MAPTRWGRLILLLHEALVGVGCTPLAGEEANVRTECVIPDVAGRLPSMRYALPSGGDAAVRCFVMMNKLVVHCVSAAGFTIKLVMEENWSQSEISYRVRQSLLRALGLIQGEFPDLLGLNQEVLEPVLAFLGVQDLGAMCGVTPSLAAAVKSVDAIWQAFLDRDFPSATSSEMGGRITAFFRYKAAVLERKRRNIRLAEESRMLTQFFRYQNGEDRRGWRSPVDLWGEESRPQLPVPLPFRPPPPGPGSFGGGSFAGTSCWGWRL
jgi:hypothetical protein